MKRKSFLKYLKEQGVYLLREGAKHSYFMNEKNNKKSSIPRHNEIKDLICKKICKDLDIESPI